MDRISELPDPLLTHILSYLPTKESVRTSVLSTRWEFLWLQVPGLDLDLADFAESDEAFESFMDDFLDFNQESKIQKFRISNDQGLVIDTSADRVWEWVSSTVDLGLQHLDVRANDTAYYLFSLMPQNIYTSDTLVSLHLEGVMVEDPKLVVSLPCLKIMRLIDIWYDKDSIILERFISGCPILEDLKLIMSYDHWDGLAMVFLRVRSQTLKRFYLLFKNGSAGAAHSVGIEAPQLEYLTYCDDRSDMIVVKNLTSLSTITIDSDFKLEDGSPLDPGNLRKRDIIRDFLTGVSSVRRMFIRLQTLEALYRYSDLGPIPKFENLSRLGISFSRNILQFLPVFLESCPNLKYLTVGIRFTRKPGPSDLSYVPRCLSTTLEYVEIYNLIRGEKSGTKLVDYFRVNSAVLKELYVSFKDSPMTKIDVLKN